MKIQQIDVYQSPIKLKEPFIISLEKLEYAENIIVNIKTDNGISGFGECSPFLTIHGESMQTGYVVADYLAKVLIGKNPLELDVCSQLMEKIIFGNTSIKSAFDMALHDIAAQFQNLPLYKFLGGKNDKKIITDYTVSLGSIEKMVADAVKIKANGFQIIKVKLGDSKEKDIEAIRQIREAVGDVITLRIDANQGWKPEETLEILKAMKPFAIQHCEEPISRQLLMELPKIKKESPILITADESCCDHYDAQRLIDLKACDLFNIKLGKSSGIVKAQKIIKLAELHNIKIQIGGFLESRLAFTAAAHLALTNKNIIFFDFDTPLMFEEDPVVDGITYSKNGEIAITEKAGLGARFETSYLKNLIRKSIY